MRIRRAKQSKASIAPISAARGFRLASSMADAAVLTVNGQIMRVLVIFAHPLGDSYAATLRNTVVAALKAGGQTVDLYDLYREGFDPVLSAQERRDYENTSENVRAVSRHVERLREAEGIILVFPSWWYGMPAILKGYFDRVWLPGV